MFTRALVLSTAMAAMALCSALTGAAPANARSRRPELVCSIAGGFGFLVYAQRGITCIYYPGDDNVEFYVGSSENIGLDSGPNNARRIAFTVTGANPDQVGALAGSFVGAKADATIGFGLSGEALVGGSTGGIALTPFQNEGDTGINFSVALGTFKLTYAGRERRTLHERY